MQNASTLMGPAAAASRRQDVAVISLIGLAHGSSHFFHMLLPPLFPFFIRDFGLSYAQLGLLVTVFFVISGVGQALSGFLVDKIGARPVLLTALGLFALASVAAALATGYHGLLLAAALAGLGNAPFHPADFTILNKRVSATRLGHAFSVHGISGNLGWALAPVWLLGVSHGTGDWRWAYASTAVLALGVLLLLVWQRHRLDDRRQTAPSPPSATSPSNASRDAPSPAAAATHAGAAEHPLAFMKLPSVWLCFSFFFWTTAALAAIQSFAGPALARVYGMPLSATAYVVTGYMVCGAVGMVFGGFLVNRTPRLERVIGWCMAGAAGLLLLSATGWLPGWAALVTVSLAGVGTGLAGPSRDMLIKRAAPPGATGRVYGTVYAGLDVGFASAAPVFGWLLDSGQAQMVLVAAAAALGAGIVSAGAVGWRLQAMRRALAKPSQSAA